MMPLRILFFFRALQCWVSKFEVTSAIWFVEKLVRGSIIPVSCWYPIPVWRVGIRYCLVQRKGLLMQSRVSGSTCVLLGGVVHKRFCLRLRIKPSSLRNTCAIRHIDHLRGGLWSSLKTIIVLGSMFCTLFFHLYRCCSWLIFFLCQHFQKSFCMAVSSFYRLLRLVLLVCASKWIVEIRGSPLKKCRGISGERCCGLDVIGVIGLERRRVYPG